jgi:hypothetical protein
MRPRPRRSSEQADVSSFGRMTRGFEHVSTIAPYEVRQFDEYPSDGLTLFADSGVYPPRPWVVKRRRLRRASR